MTDEFNWKVYRTHRPRVARAWGKRTHPDTEYIVVATREEAQEIQKKANEQRIGLAYSLVQIREPLSNGWRWTSQDRAADRRKARRAANRREEDRQAKLRELKGLPQVEKPVVVKTRPVGGRGYRLASFGVGDKVKIVHETKSTQLMGLSRLGQIGTVVNTNGYNHAVQFGNENPRYFQTNQLEEVK